MLVFAAVLLIAFNAVVADQFNWVGSYADPTYGGLLTVCVSQIGSTYYGQGLVSDVGYLRGTIDTNNVWTGNYYMAGNAATNGNFTLTLSGTFASYSGSYFQAGSGITYTVSSASRTSSLTPTDEQCFKVDSSMLTTMVFVNMTAAYDACEGENDCYKMYLGVTETTATYSYAYTYSDGSVYPGTIQGPVLGNGQILPSNWYEASDSNGIELSVAKNATHMYDLWWDVPSVADFDFSTQSVDDFGQSLMPMDASISIATANADAYSNMCYALWTASAESSCLLTATDDDSGSFDQEDHSLLVTTVVFTVATFILTLGLIAYLLLNKPRAPMASQGLAPAAVTVEMK